MLQKHFSVNNIVYIGLFTISAVKRKKKGKEKKGKENQYSYWIVLFCRTTD
jgi:hypothetical protein